MAVSTREKAAKALAKSMGITVEDAEKLLAPQEEVINNQVSETEEELAYQVQSVINYFDSKGKDFYHRPCRICNRVFAYTYPYAGITICSNVCRVRSLNDIGLEWHPERPLKDRYGPHMPATVPPEALAQLIGLFEDNDLKICPVWKESVSLPSTSGKEDTA